MKITHLAEERDLFANVNRVNVLVPRVDDQAGRGAIVFPVDKLTCGDGRGFEFQHQVRDAVIAFGNGVVGSIDGEGAVDSCVNGICADHVNAQSFQRRFGVPEHVGARIGGDQDTVLLNQTVGHDGQFGKHVRSKTLFCWNKTVPPRARVAGGLVEVFGPASPDDPFVGVGSSPFSQQAREDSISADPPVAATHKRAAWSSSPRLTACQGLAESWAKGVAGRRGAATHTGGGWRGPSCDFDVTVNSTWHGGRGWRHGGGLIRRQRRPLGPERVGFLGGQPVFSRCIPSGAAVDHVAESFGDGAVKTIRGPHHESVERGGAPWCSSRGVGPTAANLAACATTVNERSVNSLERLDALTTRQYTNVTQVAGGKDRTEAARRNGTNTRSRFARIV
ncbi:hypothetical protein DFJ77DRAFT_444060 [Powellomyces hirtus]|nr:hypothetical protein DFJ77DRAFT_444060 [Powellomyces hirtus]